MRGTMWLMTLGCGILLSSGCCGFLANGSCGGGCGCQRCNSCDGDCGPACGPVRRPYRERASADDCGDCGNCGARGSCGQCDNECGSCCQQNFCFHPLRWIGSLFYCGTYCGPSCGNTYWCEGINDPPACHEPCNRGGQWTGHTGCASCNHGGMHESGEVSPVLEGAPLQDDPLQEPTPAVKAPTKAMRRPPADSYER